MSTPTGCPPGRFCSTTGLSVTPECPARSFCPITSTTSPSDCPLGWFCPVNSTQPLSCSRVGDYCYPKSDVQTYCPAGKWCADQYTLAACAVGKYGFQGRTTPCNLDCPLGSYCPNGTG
jgi:hypothetical protein